MIQLQRAVRIRTTQREAHCHSDRNIGLGRELRGPRTGVAGDSSSLPDSPLGPLPKELQATIVYATATPSTAKERDATAALVKFLSSEPALPIIKKLGLEPG